MSQLIWKPFPVGWADSKRMLRYHGWVEVTRDEHHAYYVRHAFERCRPEVLQMLREDRHGLFEQAHYQARTFSEKSSETGS